MSRTSGRTWRSPPRPGRGRHDRRALHRLPGDFDVAEEAVEDAVLEALGAWRRDGIPDRPGAWLQAAARRNALDGCAAAASGARTGPGAGGGCARPTGEPATSTTGCRCCSAAATRRSPRRRGSA